MLARTHDADIDTGPRGDRAVTERRCVATRTVRPIGEMIRFVVAPDGSIVPDLKGKLPGRGAWVTANRQALAQAIRRKAFAAAFRREVKADAALPELTDRLMERAVLDALAICGKASLVLTGYAKVAAALANERVVALVHASDAAVDGVRKLDAALWRRDDADQVRIVTDLSSEQLDLALARPNVIHAALVAGPASEAFLARHARLTRFRAGTRVGNGADGGKTAKGRR